MISILHDPNIAPPAIDATGRHGKIKGTYESFQLVRPGFENALSTLQRISCLFSESPSTSRVRCAVCTKTTELGPYMLPVTDGYEGYGRSVE